MKKISIFFTVVLLMSSCTSENSFKKGEKQLKAQGYTEIESTGYSVFCCGDDYAFSEGFRAIDPSGDYVEGCMCSGWLKGVDIKFN